MSKYGYDEEAVYQELGLTPEQYDEIIEKDGTIQEAQPYEEGESL